ncbi:MAG: hypothetical protein GC202_02155 [Alphaproteobacteria bacterium]|nr:hypothetical protein [Alphaproteobacteria bacterium]
MRPLKPRLPGTIADAVTTIMGTLTADGAAAAVEKSAALVRKWADPDHACVPDARQIEELDAAYEAATGARGPISAVINERLAARRSGPAHVAKDPQARLGEVMSEVGEIATDLMRYGADRHLTRTERARLTKDARDAKKALDRMIRDLSLPWGSTGRRRA